MEQLEVMGLKVTAASVAELNDQIGRIIAAGQTGYVLSANVHGFNLAMRLPWLADFYRRADLVHCDGAGIILAARLLGMRIPERITYADWGWSLADFCAARGYRLFLLGGPPGLAAAAAEALCAGTPGLVIAGTHHGYFEKSGPQNRRVVAAVRESGSDILMVGMGMGLQEKWVLDNEQLLDRKLYMVCGAAFRYWAGWTRRCPRWMAESGLEWIYRLLQQPIRKAGRYLWGNPAFLLEILKHRIKYGKSPSQAPVSV